MHPSGVRRVFVRQVRRGSLFALQDLEESITYTTTVSQIALPFTVPRIVAGAAAGPCQ
jgi:hypothetical protein